MILKTIFGVKTSNTKMAFVKICKKYTKNSNAEQYKLYKN